jgi:hypothetical protein
MFSVGAGVVLFILGIILFFAGKGTKERRRKSNAGLVGMAIGFVAIISGIVQLY